MSKGICIYFISNYSLFPPPSQCLKRELECEYPSESHRGVRKKKQQDSFELNNTIIAAAGLNDPAVDAEGDNEDEE